jgi:type I restriction enzyme S subunit
MTTTFKPYPKYKPSGVEWLGDIPQHWEVMPCRAVVVERDTRNTDGGVDAYLSLMANRGIIPYEEKGDIGNKKPEDLTKCKLVMKGDFVINSMNYYIGSYGVSPYNGVCSPVYVVMTPLPSVDHRYAFRIFENKQFQQLAQTFGNGILEHRRSIGWDILKTMRVAVPMVEEQSVIANFLDSETSKIDETIKELEASIGLLNEEKTSLINEYVTGKINPETGKPYPKYKPSGVEWLGEIPEHWKTNRLQRLARIQTGNTPKKSDASSYAEEGTPWVKPDDLASLQPIRATKEYLSDDGLKLGRPVPAGSVLVCCIGSVGKVGFSDTQVTTNQQINALTFDDNNTCPRFAIYMIIASECEHVRKANKNVVLILNGTHQGSIQLPSPPLTDQIAIGKFLDEAIAKTNSLISEKESLIESLKEYRTSLIHEAVTGKIDLRKV